MVLSVQDFAGGIPSDFDPASQILKGLNAREQIQNKPLRQQQLQQNFDIGQQNIALNEQNQQIQAQKIQAFEQQQVEQQQAQAVAVQKKQKFDQLETELDLFARTKPALNSMLKLAPQKLKGDRLVAGDARRKTNADSQIAQGVALAQRLRDEGRPEEAQDIMDLIVNEPDPDIRASNIKGMINFGDNLRSKLEAEGIIDKPSERKFDPFAEQKLAIRQRAADQREKDAGEKNEIRRVTNSIRQQAEERLGKKLNPTDATRLDTAGQEFQEFRTRANRFTDAAAQLQRRAPDLVDDSGLIQTAGEVWKAIFGTQDAESFALTGTEELLTSIAIQNLPKGPASDRDIELVRRGVPPGNANPQLLGDYLLARARLEMRRAEFAFFTANFITDKGDQIGLIRAWRRSIAEQDAAAEEQRVAAQQTVDQQNIGNVDLQSSSTADLNRILGIP